MRVLDHKSLQKKWVENFYKSPVIDQQTGLFKKQIASQLFYGKNDGNYPEAYPHNYKAFHDSSFDEERLEAVDTVIKFLHFIGIRLTREAILKHLENWPNDYHQILSKSYYLLRSLAHKADLNNSKNPFSGNYSDIDFLISIQTGQRQLSIFDSSLPDLYKRNLSVPEGYGNDEDIAKLFDKIESSNKSFFITGKAGSGKSTFINFFTQQTKKKVVLMAFTGVAAVNISGVTIHSFFKFPLRPLLPKDVDITIFKDSDKRLSTIQEIDTIVIDEISMLRSDILEAIDYSLRNNCKQLNQIFGGKQVIFLGDIFQLPPVVDKWTDNDGGFFSELFKSPYFFDCDAYKNSNITFHEFTVSHRQKDDQQFLNLLDKVRDCSADDEIIEALNKRFDAAHSPKVGEFAITLAASNSIAKSENSRRLNELRHQKFKFQASTVGDFPEEKYPAPLELILAKGAQVILTRNDVGDNRRWVNGTIGIVDFIADDIIEVKLSSGGVYKIKKETWEHRSYKYNKIERKIVSEVKGTFEQFPLKLAWAITIHKSQGLTFEKVIIDLGGGAFVNGQLYTALSRCRTLNGIVLKRKIRKEDIIMDKRLIDFHNDCLNRTHNI